MPTNSDWNKLVRALNRQGPQHPEGRRVFGKVTARELHPTRGSTSIAQEAAAGASPKTVVSLNAPGGGRKWIWGIKGFGWTDGKL